MDKNIRINCYKIYLDVDLDKLLYKGNVLISILLTKEINIIKINAFDFQINSIKINDDDNYNWEIDNYNKIIVINKNNFIFKTDKEYNIKINFDWKKISDETDGFYYTIKNKKLVCTTHLEPISARKFIPCFDYPNLKSNFTLVVKIDSKYNCLSNMSIDKIYLDKKNNSKIIFYKTTPPMSTYLLCLVCGEINSSFNEPLKSKSGILVNGYSVEDDIKYIRWSIKKTVEALDFFESWFNIKYPLEKLDIVSIPNFSSGAMENWGLITFREEYILLYNKLNYLSQIKILEVIYHEVAHQWFGNLVTLSNWGDLWLNEATATFFSWNQLLLKYNDYNTSEFNWLLESKNVYITDARENTHPIIMNNIGELNPSELFDEITYSKGNIIINYVANLLGLNNFQLAIQKYLNKYLYSNPSSGDKLFEYFNKYSQNKNINYIDLMNKLTLTKGYPILYIKNIDNKFNFNYKTFNLNKNIVNEYPVNLFLKIKNKDIIEIIDLTYNQSTDYEIILNKNNYLFNPNNELFCISYYDNFKPNIQMMNQVELIKYSHDEFILSLYGYKNINLYLDCIQNIINQIDLSINILVCSSILNDILELFDIISLLNLSNTKIIDYIKKNLNEKLVSLFYYLLNSSFKFSELVLENILILKTIKLEDIDSINIIKKIYNYQNTLIQNSSNYFNKYFLPKTVFCVIMKYFQNEEITNILNILSKCDNVVIIDNIIISFRYLNEENFNNVFNNYSKLIKSQDYSLFFSSISKIVLKQEFIIDYWIKNNNKISTIDEIKFKILKNISKNIYNLKLIDKIINLLQQIVNDKNKLIINNIKDILTTNKIIIQTINEYLL